MRGPLQLSDLRGYSRLAVEATVGVADLVETVHRSVVSLPRTGRRSLASPTRLRGLSGFIYEAVRRVTRLAGAGVDRSLEWLERFEPRLSATSAPLASELARPERLALLSALNGVVGDHLERSGNTLAIEMELRPRQAAGSRIVLLAHGLCMNDAQWRRKGHDHGHRLAAELGYTPVYLRYNSGRPIAANGRELAERLERLVDGWPEPVTEIVAVAHSMGGLVMRSACHAAEAAAFGWRERLRKIVFLGTPHHGAPLERGGNWLNLALDATSYTAAFARLARIRSAGITDLRHGRLLPDDEPAPNDRFSRRGSRGAPLPLPRGVACYAAAGTLAKRPGRSLRALAGDGLVPLASALGEHAEPSRDLAIPATRRFVGYGMNHLDLLDRREVYEQIRAWLAEPSTGPAA